MQPSSRPPGNGLGTLLGFFALIIADGLAIKYFATTLGEALVLLGLILCSTICAGAAAVSYRQGGDQ